MVASKTSSLGRLGKLRFGWACIYSSVYANYDFIAELEKTSITTMLKYRIWIFEAFNLNEC